MSTKKRILITGATGFIGKYLIEHALKNNYIVFIALRKTSNTSRINHLKWTKIEVDYSTEAALNNAFKQVPSFDIIIHNAGVKSCYSKNEYFQYNTELTKNLCTVIHNRKLVKDQFIYISSLAALGPGNSETFEEIDENSNQNPISDYGRSKLSAEKELIKSGLKYIIIRPTAVYGEGTSDYDDVISIVRKKTAFYPTTPKQRLSFIHADDVANLVFLAIDKKNDNQIYNATDGNDYTLKLFYEIIATALQVEIKYKILVPFFLIKTIALFNKYKQKLFKIENSLNSLEKANEVVALNWRCSAQKIKKELNFTPLHVLKEIAK